MSDNNLSQQVAELEAKVSVLEDELAAREQDADSLSGYLMGERVALLKKKDGLSPIVRFAPDKSDTEILNYVQSSRGWGKSTDEQIIILRIEATYVLPRNLMRLP